RNALRVIRPRLNPFGIAWRDERRGRRIARRPSRFHGGLRWRIWWRTRGDSVIPDGRRIRGRLPRGRYGEDDGGSHATHGERQRGPERPIPQRSEHEH